MANTAKTPVGLLKYAFVYKPRESQYGTFYEVNVECANDDEALALIERLQEEARIMAEAEGVSAKDARMPFTVDEAAGTVTFKCKLRAEGKKKDGTVYQAKPPVVLDPGAKTTRVPFGQGTTGAATVEISAYHSDKLGLGVSLKLKTLHLSHIVAFEKRTASNLDGIY
jgi:hypothetical protein